MLALTASCEARAAKVTDLSCQNNCKDPCVRARVGLNCNQPCKCAVNQCNCV